MILTRNWLSRFIDLTNIKNEQISIALNSLGFEVEEEHDFSKMNDKLVIGYVEESKKIDGTHLKINKVNVGSKVLDIVCGASNVNKGQFVIVAQPGQTIANGLTLDEREIKGFKSQGMICALSEIGMPKSSMTEKENESIYEVYSPIIDKKAIGKSISEIGYEDYVWDMDLTLDRSDALAATQLLKEIANYFSLKINWNEINNELKPTGKTKTNISISKDLDDEIRTLVVQEIEVQNLDQRLNANDDIWMKHSHAKSNEELISDLAMMSAIESGQPVIVFDKDKIKSNLSLEFKTINDKTFVSLNDGNNLISLIGKKVESNYLVSFDTKNILAIYLNINPVLMRKQQKNLDCSTIDIQRFMKPLNPNLFEFGSNVFVSNLAKYNIVKNINDLNVIAKKIKNKNEFEISLQKIKDFLGIEITFDEIKKLFRTLDFKISGDDKKIIFTTDPNRTDLYGQFDICEEIARLYGYDNIEEKAPTIVARKNSKNINSKLQNKLSDYLIGLGFNNTKTYSLISSEENEKWNLFNIKNSVTLMSPLSKLHETYRLSIINSLINVSIFNSSIDNKNVKLWEIADVYNKDLLRERHLAVLTTGTIMFDKVNKINVENSYFYLKGMIESIFDLYRIDMDKISFTVMENVIDEIHPFVNAEIKYEDKILGYIFQVNPKYANDNKISKTFAFELNLTAIENASEKMFVTKQISKFQQSSRDISLLIDSKQKYEDILRALKANVEKIIDIKLVDEYEDDLLIAEDKKSITISFIFNDINKQMNEEDINQQWQIILDNAKKIGAAVR